MSQQMLSQLEELWSQVQASQEEWESHLVSDEFDICQMVPALALADIRNTALPFAHRIKFARIYIQTLRDRLCHLLKFDLNSFGDIPTDLATSNIDLFNAHRPADLLGTETPITVLHRTLSGMIETLVKSDDRIRAAEAAVEARFEDIQDNHEELRKLLTNMGDGLDGALKGKHMVNTLWDTVMGQEGKETVTAIDDDLLEHLLQGRGDVDPDIAVFERQILKFKENLALVGVKVTRHAPVTEDMEGGVSDTG